MLLKTFSVKLILYVYLPKTFQMRLLCLFIVLMQIFVSFQGQPGESGVPGDRGNPVRRFEDHLKI